tara:strand:+ start:30417 stop:30749 length:333 start_codon:yes stop_codon:yes gene_type:complete
VVGGVGSAMPKFNDLIKANERIRADFYYLSQKEHCIDILVVEIDKYKAYLASNNSTKNFTLSFEWKTKNRLSFGNSKMGLSSKTIRHMLDNRDSPATNNIDFQKILCQEF